MIRLGASMPALSNQRRANLICCGPRFRLLGDCREHDPDWQIGSLGPAQQRAANISRARMAMRLRWLVFRRLIMTYPFLTKRGGKRGAEAANARPNEL